MVDKSVKLQPGVGFHLLPTGEWKPEKIPDKVVEEAVYSGFLTIQGFRCTVFEMPDNDEWAQKSSNTLASNTLASKIAGQWLNRTAGFDIKDPCPCGIEKSTCPYHGISNTKAKIPSKSELLLAIKNAFDQAEADRDVMFNIWHNDEFTESIDISVSDTGSGIEIFYQQDANESERFESELLYGCCDENQEWDEQAALEAVSKAIELSAERVTEDSTIASKIAAHWLNKIAGFDAENQCPCGINKEDCEYHGSQKLESLDGIKCVDSNVREYSHKPGEAYPIIDGKFTFVLPDGRTAIFDGRLDEKDQNGKMTVDGVDVSDQLWGVDWGKADESGDYASLEFLGIDGTLDDVLENCIKSTTSKIATRRVQATTMTPDQLKQSLVAQLFAWDEQDYDYVNCTNPAMIQAVAKAKLVLKNKVSKIIDLTGSPNFQKSPDEKFVKLFIDLQYSVNGKSIALEGNYKGKCGLDTYWRDIYGNVAQAVGPMFSKGEQESDPGLPSDPDETLWWNGTSFSSKDPESSLMTTVSSKIAAHWLRAQEITAIPKRNKIGPILQNWKTNPPEIGDNEIIESPAGSKNKYYLYAEDSALENQNLEIPDGNGIVYQLTRWEHSDNQIIYQAIPEEFDIVEAEKAMQLDSDNTNKHLEQRGQKSLSSIIAAKWLQAVFDEAQKIIIRVSRDGYVMVPCTEGNEVSDLLDKLKSSDVMTGSQILDAVKGALGGMDISVSMGLDKTDKLMEGNQLNKSILQEMEIYNPKKSKPQSDKHPVPKGWDSTSSTNRKVENTSQLASKIAARWLHISVFDHADQCPCGINRDDCKYHNQKLIEIPNDQELNKLISDAFNLAEINRDSIEGIWGDEKYGKSIVINVSDTGSGIEIFYIPDTNRQGMEVIYDSGNIDDEWDEKVALEAVRSALKRANEEAKSSNVTVSSKIAARWLQAQGDITSQVEKTLERDGDDKDYDKAIINFVGKARKVLPSIDKALEKASEVLLSARDKIEHEHPKVQDRHVQLFLQELASKHREFEDIRKRLMKSLTSELDKYEAESDDVALAQSESEDDDAGVTIHPNEREDWY